MEQTHESQAFPVDLDAFTRSSSDPGVLVSEASDCRFPVGKWPKTILLKGLADGVQLAHFVRFDKRQDGELIQAVYKTLNYELHIFND